MQTNESTQNQAAQLAVVRDEPMSVSAVLTQVALIQEIMRASMKLDTHYGKVTGCGDRMVLFKPGAEKLAMTFRLAPTYVVEQSEPKAGHREFIVRCSLTHVTTRAFLGEGVGSCSTLEGKYRYRWTGQGTDRHKVENEDPADAFNTILKMAKKRALVDAILTATGASDIFTQDLEDLEEKLQAEGTGTRPKPNLSRERKPAPAGSGTFTATPTECKVVKEGKSDKGPWKMFVGTFDNGKKVVTFSATDAKTLSDFIEAKQPLVVHTKPGKKDGDLDLVSLDEAPETQDDASRAEDGK